MGARLEEADARKTRPSSSAPKPDLSAQNLFYRGADLTATVGVTVVVPRLGSQLSQRRQIRYPSRKGGSHGCSFIKKCLYFPEAVDHG